MVQTMEIRIEDDLDLKKIADSGQCFRWTEIGPDSYRIIADDKCLRIRKTGDSRFALYCPEEEFQDFWHDYLDLDESYSGIREKIERDRDEFLYRASEHEKGIRILRQNPWEMLITFIISQNKNIPAIRRSIELLAETCGSRLTDREGDQYFAFPTAEAVAGLKEEQLRACSLGYRCRYIHEAAMAVANGDMDLNRLTGTDEEETLQALTGLSGVGKKVASCVSLFGLHRLNAFPIDVWIKRILAEQYPNGYPFDDYSPFNGVYQQYMFAYYRNSDKHYETGRLSQSVSDRYALTIRRF